MIERMKKVSLVAGLVVVVLAFTVPAYAQIPTRVGPMLALTSGDLDETGLGVVAEFGIAQKFSLAPQFILYFPGDNLSLFELNFNGNYYFVNQNSIEFYGLGGLNIARVSYNGPGEDFSDSEIGLNIGAGINFENQQQGSSICRSTSYHW